MTPPNPDSLAISKKAILLLAEIKAATEAFDQGEISAFDALDAIEAAFDTYGDAIPSRRGAA